MTSLLYLKFKLRTAKLVRPSVWPCVGWYHDISGISSRESAQNGDSDHFPLIFYLFPLIFYWHIVRSHQERGGPWPREPTYQTPELMGINFKQISRLQPTVLQRLIPRFTLRGDLAAYLDLKLAKTIAKLSKTIPKLSRNYLKLSANYRETIKNYRRVIGASRRRLIRNYWTLSHAITI